MTTHFLLTRVGDDGRTVFFDGFGWSPLRCNALPYTSLLRAVQVADRVAAMESAAVKIDGPHGGYVVEPRRAA